MRIFNQVGAATELRLNQPATLSCPRLAAVRPSHNSIQAGRGVSYSRQRPWKSVLPRVMAMMAFIGLVLGGAKVEAGWIPGTLFDFTDPLYQNDVLSPYLVQGSDGYLYGTLSYVRFRPQRSPFVIPRSARGKVGTS